jgi:DNA-binding response OmpR family regulator
MPPKRVLVVEDNADQRLALSVRLEASHYHPICVGDGDSALAVAERERPDLIVLDLTLPGTDGFHVLERMWVIPQLAGIPVIVLTARDPVAAHDRSVKLGAAAFLEKPVDGRELIETIHAVLDDAP